MEQMYRIIDTTLREGEQTPGVSFTLNQKKTILAGLVAIGVHEAEIGLSAPLAGRPDDLIRHCRRHHPQLRLALWSRCRPEDIAWAGRCRPDVLSLSIPVSDLHLNERLGKNRNWAREQMTAAIASALAAGMAVSIGFEDATRADRPFLAEMAGIAEEAGAGRIRLADTVGIASPQTMAQLVGDIRQVVRQAELAVHTHNDFGMATANAIAALGAGAAWVDATVLGLGERAGCARLEEVAGYLSLVLGLPGLAPEGLRPLSEYVASCQSLAVDPGRPLIGRRIFTCETGLHLQGLQVNPATYEPYPPESVGGRRRLVFGAKCGRRALLQRLADLGQRPDAGRLEHGLAAVRRGPASPAAPLTDADLIAAFC